MRTLSFTLTNPIVTSWGSLFDPLKDWISNLSNTVSTTAPSITTPIGIETSVFKNWVSKFLAFSTPFSFEPTGPLSWDLTTSSWVLGGGTNPATSNTMIWVGLAVIAVLFLIVVIGR